MKWMQALLVNIPREGENGSGSGAPQDGATPSPAAVAPEVTGAESSSPTPSPTPAKTEVPAWVSGRISSLTGKARELEEKLAAENQRRAELEAQLAQFRGAPGQVQPQVPPPRQLSEMEIENLATQKAQEMAFNQASQRVYNEGQSKYPDFAQAVIQINSALGGMTREFVEAAIESGAAPDVIYALSKDLNKAAEVMGAGSPTKVAAAVVKFASQLQSQNQPKVMAPSVSGAPAPIQPKVGGKVQAEPSLDNENLSTREWMELRRAQLRARHGGR